MDVGQVSFKDTRKVKRVLVAARENPIVNRLNKTKIEKKPDFKQEKDDRLKELRRADQAMQLQRVSTQHPCQKQSERITGTSHTMKRLNICCCGFFVTPHSTFAVRDLLITAMHSICKSLALSLFISPSVCVCVALCTF